jgi:hypothetical protein
MTQKFFVRCNQLLRSGVPCNLVYAGPHPKWAGPCPYCIAALARAKDKKLFAVLQAADRSILETQD